MVRARLAERTISELVRGSASTCTRWPPSTACPAARAPSSSTRLTMVAISSARPWRSWIISASAEPGRSSEAMMSRRRRRLSA